MIYLESACFTGVHTAAELLKRFAEEGSDEIRLEPPRFRLLHFFLYRKQTLRAERLL